MSSLKKLKRIDMHAVIHLMKQNKNEQKISI